MYQCIVNPSAGAGRGYRIWKQLEQQLELENQMYEVFFTEKQQDAAEIAKRLTTEKDEAKVLIVVGGEGTYNEVLNGICFERGLLTLGYLPAGFRNALSKGCPPGFQRYGQIKKLLHPKYFQTMDYGVVTSGETEIFSRRFAGRLGIGLDAAICQEFSDCQASGRFGRLRLRKIHQFLLGLRQLVITKPAAGYVLFDGVKRVEFSQIFFLSFLVQRDQGKKKTPESADGSLKVYVACTANKRHMLPILVDVILGIRKKERGVRIFECHEASVHLARPLAVHVDGESLGSQQEFEVRCIQKRLRIIGP